jgi:hypothetical protein
VLSIIGYVLLFKTVKIQLFVLGFISGWFMSSVLYGMIMTATGFGAPWLFWTTVATCCLIAGLIAAYKGEWLILLSTSFIGAYLLMRGFAFFFGGYPDEKVIRFKIS